MNKLDLHSTVSHFLAGPNWMRFAIATILIGFGVVWALPASTAGTATINVTTTADDLTNNGNCTLREAIIAANTDTAVDACPAGSGADTINLPAGNYTLSIAGKNDEAGATGDLDINGDLTIVGAGWTTIIDGNDLDRVFDVHDGQVTLKLLHVTDGGNNPGHGGGIQIVNGSLTLELVQVTSSQSNGLGGGIRVTGATTSVTILHSRIIDNTAAEGGGGVYSSRPLTIVNSTIADNQGSYGGGIANSFGEAIILNSAITSNKGTTATSGGGGIYSSGDTTIVNSTISGNSTNRASGGGLTQLATGTSGLHNVTITNNTVDLNQENNYNGGGVYVGGDAEVILANSIIAGNVDNSTNTKHPDCSGANFESLGYNLIQSVTGCTIGGDTTGNLTGVDPKLGALAGNGALTQTHALLAGSPAINAGDPDDCKDHEGNLLFIDQRFLARPPNGCDMGAYEANSPGTPTPSPTPNYTPTPTATNPPTATNTPPVTMTPTDGPSPAPTATATDGPSPTPTETETPGPSPTPFVPTDWNYLPGIFYDEGE